MYSNWIVVRRSCGASLGSAWTFSASSRMNVSSAPRIAAQNGAAAGPQLGLHLPSVELPQGHDLIAEHERVTVGARDLVHTSALWRVSPGAQQDHDRPHGLARRRHRGARVIEQTIGHPRTPVALDLDVYDDLAGSCARA